MKKVNPLSLLVTTPFSKCVLTGISGNRALVSSLDNRSGEDVPLKDLKKNKEIRFKDLKKKQRFKSRYNVDLFSKKKVVKKDYFPYSHLTKSKGCKPTHHVKISLY